MSARIAAPLLALTLSMQGCWFKKKQPASPPPPAAAPQRPPLEVPPPKPEPPPPLEAPKIEAPPPAAVPEAEPTVIRPKLEKADPPKPAPRKATRRRAAPPTRPKEAAPAAAPAAADPPAQPEPPPAPAAPPIQEAPKLGEVLPEAKRREYLASIDNDLSAAQKVLREIAGRSLNKAQSDNASRIRAFVQQAMDSRAVDITGAVQLARRAAILAAELARSLDR